MSHNGLAKSERLCSEGRIGALFEKGSGGVVGPLRFKWRVVESAEAVEVKPGWEAGESGVGVSVLFSVPKKVFRRAWKRNLLKRRMRESYRVRKHGLLAAVERSGCRVDLALICSPSPAPVPASPPSSESLPDFKTIDDAIVQILDRVSRRV